MTDPQNSTNQTPLVFVSDPSAEAHGLATALQSSGYAVIEVASSLLAARIAAQPPALLICDAAYTAQIDLATLLEELEPPLVLLGSPTPDFKLAPHQVALSRPVDAESLKAETQRLIGIPSKRDRRSMRQTAPPPPLFLSPGGQITSTTDDNQTSSPALSIPPAPRLPADAPTNLERAHTEISAELAELLRRAEQTLRDASGPPLTDAQRALIEPDLSATDVVADELLGVLDDALDPAESDASHLLFGPNSGPEGAARAALTEEPTRAGTHETHPGKTLSDQTRTSQPVTQAGALAFERNTSRPPAAAGRPSSPGLGGRDSKPPADEETTNPGGRVAPSSIDAVAHPPGPSSSASKAPSLDDDPAEQTAPGDEVAVTAATHVGRARPTMALIHIAKAVADRFTGALAFETKQGLRRVVTRDGDFVTTASTRPGESLICYVREHSPNEIPDFEELSHKVAPFGRHGGAALVAAGVLAPGEMWSVLRGHAEWLLTRILFEDSERPVVETQVPERFADEPSVFGGTPGAEVFVGICKACFDYDFAWRAISEATQVKNGPHRQLIGESGLTAEELDVIEQVCHAEARLPKTAKPWCVTLLALGVLGVLEFAGLEPDLVASIRRNPNPPRARSTEERSAPSVDREAPPSSYPSAATPASVHSGLESLLPLSTPAFEPLAVANYEPVPSPRTALRPPSESRPAPSATSRQRIRDQQTLADTADYFSVLGLDVDADQEQVERAYQRLRQEFEPSLALSSDTADLAAALDDILLTLDEAYTILGDPRMLEEYRRALG